MIKNRAILSYIILIMQPHNVYVYRRAQVVHGFFGFHQLKTFSSTCASHQLLPGRVLSNLEETMQFSAAIVSLI
jgi:hypothetical protein